MLGQGRNRPATGRGSARALNACSYVLPIRRAEPAGDIAELAAYLAQLPEAAEVIVVDGSPSEVFANHALEFPRRVCHLRPDALTANGKVGSVLTGIRRSRHERVVIADDDVRYGERALARIVAELDRFDLVLPQNHFVATDWHALWDTSRTLLNRVSGGDWPGTLAVRRSRLMATGGYRGDVMFENLELVRTVRASGGSVSRPLDLYVPRLPPTTKGFLGQRVRQAYDELARPVRLAVWLSVMPLLGLAAARHAWRPVLGAGIGLVAAAEIGRRRAGGRRVFPATAALLAPLWVIERGACAWLAVGSRAALGGIRYRGGTLRDAASSEATLRRRLRPAAGGPRGGL